MTTAQFKEAFRRGLGSAMIALQNSDSREAYKEVILWCCLHNTCYDMQFDGDRSNYLFSAIYLFEDRSYFENAIIEKYRQKKIDTWLFDQLSGLLYYFAANDSETAREALYQRFDELIHRLPRIRNEKEARREGGQFEWLCIWLTMLDGIAAFKILFDRVSIAFSKSKCPYFIMDWFYINSENRLGKKRVRAYAEKQAAKSSAMDDYWKKLQEKINYEGEPINPPTIEEFIRICRERVQQTEHDDKGVYRTPLIRYASRFAHRATPDELTALANMVVAEESLDLKSALLKVFQSARFPLGENQLFEFLNIEHKQMREITLKALELFESDEVHDFAVRLLTEGKDVCSAIRLLCRNFRKEDEALLLSGLKRLPITLNGDWHEAHTAVLTLFESNSFKPKTDILQYMYRHTICSFCRFYIVRSLHKKNS